MNSPDETLILFTRYFPFGPVNEIPFLSPELVRLVKLFAKVIVVPAFLGREKAALPEGVRVEEGFARGRPAAASIPAKAGRLVSACRSALLYRELFTRPVTFFQPSALRYLLSYVSQSQYTTGWLKEFIRREEVNISRTVFYSYWTDGVTLGVALARSEFPGIKLVSRLHGIDLYGERHPHGYIPLRKETLTGADCLLPVSAAGRDYLQRKYAGLRLNLKVAPLGVDDPGFLAQESVDGIFRVVSCSYMKQIKRLDLLAEGLAETARLRPEERLEWHHLGDGPERSRICGKVKKIFPSNAEGFFHGLLPNREVTNFYRTHPAEVFVSVSSSEGGRPISILEAQSVGLPVIATAVGGVPEIVTEENGILLPPDPGPRQVAAALLKCHDDPGLRRRKGKAGRNTWAEMGNAEKNCSEFAEVLKACLSGGTG